MTMSRAMEGMVQYSNLVDSLEHVVCCATSSKSFHAADDDDGG